MDWTENIPLWRWSFQPNRCPCWQVTLLNKIIHLRGQKRWYFAQAYNFQSLSLSFHFSYSISFIFPLVPKQPSHVNPRSEFRAAMWAFLVFFGAAVLAGSIPPMPIGPPLVCIASSPYRFRLVWSSDIWTQPAPKYMVDNHRNTFGAAPDKGILNGPVTSPIDMTSLKSPRAGRLKKKQSSVFWMDEIKHGQVSGIRPAIIF